MKEFLSKNEIKFVYLDISESLSNLKAFLKYRDSRPEFDDIRESGRVGIPCIVVNKGERVFFYEIDIEQLRDQI